MELSFFLRTFNQGTVFFTKLKKEVPHAKLMIKTAAGSWSQIRTPSYGALFAMKKLRIHPSFPCQSILLKKVSRRKRSDIDFSYRRSIYSTENVDDV